MKHIPSEGAKNFAYVIGAQTRETIDRIEDGDLMLKFVRSAWVCEYFVFTLNAYDLKGNKLILKAEILGKNLVKVYL